MLEAYTLISSLKVARGYQEGQFCLNRAIHLKRLSEAAAPSGLRFDAVANHVLAQTLWDHGEVSIPIQMLQTLSSRSDLDEQDIPVSLVEVFADMVRKQISGVFMANSDLEPPNGRGSSREA